ncbi:MAG: hypothetical protein ABH881_02725 [bacterium]
MTEEKKQSEMSNNKLCALLSYLLIGIIWYFADANMRKDSFIKFHVQQAIVLLVFSICGQIILSATFILIPLVPLYGLAMLVLLILGLINAYQGKKKELPFIGKFGSLVKI